MNAPDQQPEGRSDHEFGQRARLLYQQAAQHIGPHTAGKLRAARREALKAAEKRPSHVARWLIPTGAFAVIAMATMMMWQPTMQHHEVTPAQPSGSGIAADLDSDLPPDADQTDPNLYQNLDFYGWLAASHTKPAVR